MSVFEYRYSLKSAITSFNGRVSIDEISGVFSDGGAYQALVLGDIRKPTVVIYSSAEINRQTVQDGLNARLNNSKFMAQILSFRKGLPKRSF